ncbi:hypothetical protein C0991_004011 [Blastosporella zonata]|nr:hypothetical protein C0991_004011 [Blastosporella zonata]
MSSNCPPQLHLELPPNTTSFKRSFDQFGFDLESPLAAADGGSGSSGSDGHDRNKRARSASSFSDDDSPMSGESTHEPSVGAHLSPVPRLGVPHLSLNIGRSSLEPPRIPTPEIQDIDMADYPLPAAEEAEADPTPQPDAPIESTVSQAEESYRLSLERFNAFDAQISSLRQALSPTATRSPTPPPVLPPLELLSEEAPINTNHISFLHPPAQPSPPLPHSLYNYGPSRNQPSGSRTANRNEPPFDDPRRLPHETHTQPLAESSDSRGLASEADSEETWTWGPVRRTSDMFHRRRRLWSVWPSIRADDDDENDDEDDAEQEELGEDVEDEDDEDDDDDEEEEGEVQEVLARVSNGAIWNSAIPVIPPTLGILRSPSPLFNDDMDPQSVPLPTPRRVHEDTAPPTLPPIEDQVFSQAWDPMEDVLNTVWNRDDTRDQSQPPRIPIPQDIAHLSSHSSDDGHSATNATTGSSSSHDVTSLDSSLAGWLNHEDPWFIRSPGEPGPSTQGSRGTSTTANPSNSATTNNNSSSHSLIDTYAVSRLQALQGIGTALEGIGQVLRESEITLGPYLRDSSNNNSGNNTINTTDATAGSSSAQSNATASRSPSVRSSAGGRTSAWRSTSSADREGNGEPSVQRPVRRNPPSLPSPLFDEDSGTPSGIISFDWNNDSTSPCADEPWINQPSLPPHRRVPDENVLRRMLARYRSSPPAGSTTAMRTRAEAAAVLGIDEQFWPPGDWPMDDQNDPTRTLRTSSPMMGMHSTTRGDNSTGVRRLPVATLRDELPALTGLSDPQPSVADRSSWGSIGHIDVAMEEQRERRRERERQRREQEAEAGRQRRAAIQRSMHPSPFTGSSLNQLRVLASSQSNTNAVAHSNSVSASQGRPLASFLPSSTGDRDGGNHVEAYRRILRMDMQRLREGRTPPIEPPSSIRPLLSIPPRPRGINAPSSRRLSLDDSEQLYERLAEHRAQLMARVFPNRPDRNQNTSSAGVPGMDRMANPLDTASDSGDTPAQRLRSLARRSLAALPGTGEASSERSLPPLEQSMNRIRTSLASASSHTTANGDTSPTTNNTFDRTPFAPYLPIPPMPSPDLEIEFTSTSPNGWSVLERPRVPSSTRPGPVVPRRSPSPGHRRRLARSPPRRSPPASTASTIGEFDPDLFAPGPFRNTIRSLRPARNRDTRAVGASQTSSTQRRVAPPSLPPLEFEDERRPSAAQQPEGTGGDLYRSEFAETTHASHFQAFHRQHHSPSSLSGTNSQRFNDGDGNRLQFLTDMYPSDPPGRPTAMSDNRNMSNSISWWPLDLNDDTSANGPPPPSVYRPPWRAFHPRRAESHRQQFLPSSTPGVDEDGFTHAIDALREDTPNINRPQHRADSHGRLPRYSSWGGLDDLPENGPSRSTTNTDPRPWGRVDDRHLRTSAATTAADANLQRRRRALDRLYNLDLSDDDTETGLPFDRSRFMAARRFRNGTNEVQGVYPQRLAAFARLGGARLRGRPLGDYMRDEDFNGDYESLILLASTLGDAKPRSTPDEVIAGLETGLFKDWRTAESDQRCPICLDDMTRF